MIIWNENTFCDNLTFLKCFCAYLLNHLLYNHQICTVSKDFNYYLIEAKKDQLGVAHPGQILICYLNTSADYVTKIIFFQKRTKHTDTLILWPFYTRKSDISNKAFKKGNGFWNFFFHFLYSLFPLDLDLFRPWP